MSVDDRDEDVVWVRAQAMLRGEHRDDLWSALEWALHEAEGRVVILDLSRVVELDDAVIMTVTDVARTAQRWRRELGILVDRSDTISRHFAAGNRTQLVSIYQTQEQVLAALDTPNR